MTRDDMIRSFAHCLDRFAAEVAAAEREACAKVCEEKADRYSERAAQPEKVRDINLDVAKIAVQTCGHLAAVIRKRGEDAPQTDEKLL
jgi:hypothetical protein